MSNDLLTTIAAAKDQFIGIVEANPGTPVEWKREANFAMQQMYKNPHSLSIAMGNKVSLRDAIIQVAAIGITLNPAHQYAYLVPMDKEITLFISYRGLIKVATDTGSIKWARADVVYENDTFNYYGPAKEPEHVCNPFSDRGAPIGVYCIAKTADGDILCDVMPEEEIQKIKSKSKSATGNKPQYSPWNQWPDEMRKKAIIKRASKTWPKTERHEKLDQVIEYINEKEGIDFEPKGQVTGDPLDVELMNEVFEVVKNAIDEDDEQYAMIQSQMDRLTDEEQMYVMDLFGGEKPEGSRKGYKSILNEILKTPLDSDGNPLVGEV